MMKDYIQSKDYRKFLEENHIVLSDWDKATLIYQAFGMSHYDKILALLEIKKQTGDQCLQVQIEERLDRDHRLYEEYKKCNGNAYYRLSEFFNGRYDVGDIYLRFEDAYADGKKTGAKFRIEKELFACKKQSGDTDGVFGMVEFNEQGYIQKILWMYERNQESDFKRKENDEPERFEERYVDLPLFYRRGDIVHVIGTEYIGIVNEPADDAEEEKYRNMAKHGDYSDFQVAVNLMFDGDKFLSVFAHDHIQPTNLEYAVFDDEDPRKGFLEYIRQVLYEHKTNTLVIAADEDEIVRNFCRANPNLGFETEEYCLYSGDAVASVVLNMSGEIERFISHELSEDEKIVDSYRVERFEFHFIKMPWPLHAGTSVRDIRDGSYYILGEGEEDWKRYLERIEEKNWYVDFSDIQVICYELTESGIWSHEHINPLYLEVEFPTYIEEDLKRQTLRCAMEALGDYLSHKSKGKEFCPDLVLKYTRKYAEVCRKKTCQKRYWKKQKSQKIL